MTAGILNNDTDILTSDKKSATTPISLFGVSGVRPKQKVNNDTTTTVAIANDQVKTTTAISISTLSPNQNRLTKLLSSHLEETLTKISDTKRACSDRHSS